MRIYFHCALVLNALLLGWGAWCNSPTVDEPGHLVAGLSHWHLGRYELYRVNPPLVRLIASVPVLWAGPKTDWRRYYEGPGERSEFRVGEDFLKANKTRSIRLITLARFACIPFSLIGAWVCYSWSCELYGLRAGMLAVTLWCFCPNILGHSQLITPDAAAASLNVLALYSVWHWLRAPTMLTACITGAALGLAELTKTTLLINYLVIPLVWAVWRCAQPVREASRPSCIGLVSILSVSLLVINSGYGFDNTLKRLGDFDFVSYALGGDSKAAGNVFRETCFARLRIPLPEHYVRGLDSQKSSFEKRTGHSYLRGEFRKHGWWYYYIYAFAIKTPIGTLGLACLRLITWQPRTCLRQHYLNAATLLIPAIFLFALVSSQTGFSRHLRYVLPVFPLLFIWTSRVAAVVSNSTIKALVVGLAACSAIASLAHFPHSLSFFNSFVGGPKNGHSHLLGSNLDWGQDLLFLDKWLRQNPQARPIRIAYDGVDPQIVGLQNTYPSPGPLAGWYAISVNILRGQEWIVTDERGNHTVMKDNYNYLLRGKPAAMAGYSIYIFNISEEEAQQMSSARSDSTKSVGLTQHHTR